MVTTMSPFPTSQENLALDLIFRRLGASRFNRTMDEYMDVASRAPKLAAMHADVNAMLHEMAKAGYAPYEICYFKAGDRFPWYEPFPTSLSLETIRKAWVKSGMRELQRQHKRLKAKNKRSH
jgi:hypothetical protein